MKPMLTITALLCLFLPLSIRAEEDQTLRRVSEEFVRALVAGQEQGIRQRIASFEEMSAIFNRVKDKKEYLALVDAWVMRLKKEIEEAKQQGPVAFDGVEISDAMIIYPDSDKIKKPAIFAIVYPIFKIKGKSQKGFFPLFFIQVGRHWKVSIKK